MEDSSNGTTESGLSQPPEPPAAESQCPICLEEISKPACSALCKHWFCFSCIRRWGKRRNASCPLCRQPMERLLYQVKGGEEYEEYLVGLTDRQRRLMAMDRTLNQSPQHRYNLRPRPRANEPSAGSSGSAETGSSPSQDAAAGPAQRERSSSLPRGYDLRSRFVEHHENDLSTRRTRSRSCSRGSAPRTLS